MVDGSNRPQGADVDNNVTNDAPAHLPASTAVLAESVLDRRYRLLAPLNTRGPVTLWRGDDNVLARPVAVRIVEHPDGSGDPGSEADQAALEEVAESLLKAAISSGRLVHPGAASTYDATTTTTGSTRISYVVSEWVEGRTLRQLAAEGPPRPEQAGAIVLAAARVLAAAHERGIHHGGLNPGDVIVSGHGTVKVVDLEIGGILAGLDGSATGAEPTVGAGTDSGAGADGDAGSSSEANGGDGAGAGAAGDLADVRALGALLYAGLTGAWPLLGEHALPAAPTANGRLRTPRQVNAAVPRDLDAIALATLGDERAGAPITTAAELVAELEAVSPVDQVLDTGLMSLGDEGPASTEAMPVDGYGPATGDFQDRGGYGGYDSGPNSYGNRDGYGGRGDYDGRGGYDNRGDYDNRGGYGSRGDYDNRGGYPGPGGGGYGGAGSAAGATGSGYDRRGYDQTAYMGRGGYDQTAYEERGYGAGGGAGGGGYDRGDERERGYDGYPAQRGPSETRRHPDDNRIPPPDGVRGGSTARRVLPWLALAVVVVLVAIVAVIALQNKDDQTPGTDPGTSPSSTTMLSTGQKIDIAGVTAFDPPPGDGEENNDSVSKAADGNTSTEWTTSGYAPPRQFGGLKEGVGLRFTFNEPVAPSEVAVTIGSLAPVSFELRAGDTEANDINTYPLVGVAQQGKSGKVSITMPSDQQKHKYWVVWLTELPAGADGKLKGSIAEVEFKR
ncbi:serine/threonine protein kinase [Frankia sp. R43]|uniref:protein kinase family protein n=1 Tax=Frankia sp. R43 TaxID=269536 RepID=UPI0006CA0E0C|nr:protein kinase family protein [Frankia sp. R43]KPM52863.1 serine/threonine protein kinase [Frankia sp. R43]